MKEILNTMLSALTRGEGVMLCSILKADGSSPRGAGAHMAVFADGTALGTVGGGAVERQSILLARELLKGKRNALRDFAHAHGGVSRIQAHGTWGDILRVYAAADIPEGETFGDHRTLEVNTIHRRLAASAGHVYGRNIVSNETFTWLKRPRFTETLEEMKAAVDAVFCDGMNMIVNHGYAYSPEKAGRRGWPFYASTHINHTTPWWPFYRHLSEYIHRVSAMLRRGTPRAEVAVYLPQADVYSDNMLSELHLAMRLEEHLGRARMDGIQKSGYWFDYIND